MSFSYDKVTTGTYNFVSVILNSSPVGATIAGSSPSASFSVISTKAQFFDQVKINSTSQLIIGIFKLLQNLLKYFHHCFHLCSSLLKNVVKYLLTVQTVYSEQN